MQSKHGSKAERRAIGLKQLNSYIRNVGVLIGQSFVQRVLGMITTILLARVLGAASFGTYSVVTATSSSAYGLVRLGIDAAIHVNVAEGVDSEEARRKTEEMLGAGLAVLLCAGLVAGMGCLLAADWLASTVYGNAAIAIWIRIGGIAALLQCLYQFLYATLAGLHRFTDFAKVILLSSSLNVISIPIAAWGAGLAGAVTALVLVQAITVGLLAITVRRVVRSEGISLRFKNWAVRAGQLISLGFPFYAAGLVAIPVAYYLQGQLVQHAGLSELGYLRVILSLVAIVSFAPQSAAAAMVSMFTRTRVQESNMLASRVMQNVKFVSIFALLTSSVVIAGLPLIIYVLLGDTYMPVAGVAGLGLVTAVLMAANGVVSNALFSNRKVMLIFVATLVQSGLFMGLGMYLIPQQGLIGYLVAELTGCIAVLVGGIVISATWRSAHHISLDWLASMALPILLLAGFVIWQLQNPGGLTMLRLLSGAGLFLAIGCWVQFIVLSAEERSSLVALVSGRGISTMSGSD